MDDSYIDAPLILFSREPRVRDRAAAVDAFGSVLRRLKALEGLRVTAIRSSFFAGGMPMNVRVEGYDRARLASFSLPLDAYSYAYCNGTWAKLAIRERVEVTKKNGKFCSGLFRT